MDATLSYRPFVDGLYSEFLHRGISYFLPGSRLEPAGTADEYTTEVSYRRRSDGVYELAWLGQRYALFLAAPGLTPHEKQLLKSIGMVLAARYELFQQQQFAAQSFRLFRGQPEDRYVSAFLERGPHLNASSVAEVPDRISSVIEVLRVSAMTTYENRRIVTGVLLFGPHEESCHEEPELSHDALPYNAALTSIRSFHRLSDGLQSVALVDRNGLLADLVDVQRWARPYAHMQLPVPSAARYEAHSRATLCGGHVCLVLTPYGEIKVFSEGAQTFRFLDGRWQLTDAVEKYRRWCEALEDEALARCLYTASLNMVEERRGGLFVVLNDTADCHQLVLAGDLVDNPLPAEPDGSGSKDQLHYLLRQRRVVDMPTSVLETIARIDGAIVLSRDSRVLAFGAILRHGQPMAEEAHTAEGGRTTAAFGASRFGKVLKVSEDGLVSFYDRGRLVWEM